MSKSKKRIPKARPLYRAEHLKRLAGIIERLNYNNKFVVAQASVDMRKFIADHGEMNAGLMLDHLQSGDAIEDGPLVGGGVASMTQSVGHA